MKRRSSSGRLTSRNNVQAIKCPHEFVQQTHEGLFLSLYTLPQTLTRVRISDQRDLLDSLEADDGLKGWSGGGDVR